MKEQITKEKLENIVKNSLSKAEVLRKLDKNVGSGNYKLLDRKIQKFKIDIKHFTGGAWNTGSRYKPIPNAIKYSDEEVFSENSKLVSTSGLRRRLLKDNIIEYKCALCSLNTVWNNKEIVLHIDHINGVNSDNRIENLRFLCPNCHSQTDTYCGKNSSRKKENVLKTGSLIDKKLLNLTTKIENKKPINSKSKIDRTKPRPNCLLCGEKCHTLRAKYCSYKCSKQASASLIPKKQEILNAFEEYKSFRQVGIYFNVSDTAIKKWCLKYGILSVVKKNLKRNKF